MTYTVTTTVKFEESCLAEAREWERKHRLNYGNDIASLLFDWGYDRSYPAGVEAYDIEESVLEEEAPVKGYLARSKKG